ncbi:hypothetical protein IH86_23435 [Sphingobium yanoikuyae]|nr:hypothetical protein IH86_23435 [Sphingobium yanoikuyae]
MGLWKRRADGHALFILHLWQRNHRDKHGSVALPPAPLDGTAVQLCRDVRGGAMPGRARGQDMRKRLKWRRPCAWGALLARRAIVMESRRRLVTTRDNP